MRWPPNAKNWLIIKDPYAEKDWEQEKKGTTEDEMVGWHHQLNGCEFEQSQGYSEGQGTLVCCSSWGHSQTWPNNWTTRVLDKLWKKTSLPWSFKIKLFQLVKMKQNISESETVLDLKVEINKMYWFKCWIRLIGMKYSEKVFMALEPLDWLDWLGCWSWIDYV